MLHHPVPSLSATVVGEADQENNLALFRGIPYASVTQRWQQSTVLDTLPSPFDASKFGPRCPQEHGDVLVYGGVNDPIPGDDEFACLNLNITCPLAALSKDSSKPLPVMVWIHGGGFRFGANSVARYRPQELMRIATQSSHPFVLVQIGYRLGPFGFAASHDLTTAEPTGLGYAAIGNYGLMDQRNAFRWVQAHIEDFGGDPANVTAFGISAGSASIHFHLLSGEGPLFDRAILMSGTAPSLGPLPFEVYNAAWGDLCHRVGVEGDGEGEDSAAGRVNKLRALEPETLLEYYSKEALGACEGVAMLPTPDWKMKLQSPLPSSSRCKSLILGDSRVEAIIFDGLIANLSLAEFTRRARAVFTTESEVNNLLHAFGLDSPHLSNQQYRDGMRTFLSLILFQYPNFLIADSCTDGEEVYLYHFEEPSPYPGPTYGLPYHGQCALFMYNNETPSYTEEVQNTAREMARLWAGFAHGEAPWERYTDKKGFFVFGPRGECGVRNMETDKLRDYRALEWVGQHFEGCKLIAQSLLHERIRRGLEEGGFK